MYYESETGEPLGIQSDELLDQLLASLDGVANSYASLTAMNGSYIQVGGGPQQFIVDLRMMKVNQTYRHFKAVIGAPAGKTVTLKMGVRALTVDTSELLDLATTRKLFHYFRANNARATTVKWIDITETFLDGAAQEE